MLRRSSMKLVLVTVRVIQIARTAQDLYSYLLGVHRTLAAVYILHMSNM